MSVNLINIARESFKILKQTSVVGPRLDNNGKVIYLEGITRMNEGVNGKEFYFALNAFTYKRIRDGDPRKILSIM